MSFMQELNGQRRGRSPRLGLNTFYNKRFLVTDGSPSVFSDTRAGNFWIFSTPHMSTISIRVHPHDVSQASLLPHRPHLHTPFRGDPHFKNQCWGNINSQLQQVWMSPECTLLFWGWSMTKATAFGLTWITLDSNNGNKR